MTFTDLIAALFRRWPIVVAGILLTVGISFLATRADPVYMSRAQVVFMAPSSQVYPNSLQTRSEDLIITAGIVAKRINGADEPLKFASTDANLAGIPSTGESTWIRLPDTGGQWAPNFADQLLLVDSTGASPVEVERNQAAAIAEIRAELDAIQREQGVNPVDDITVTVAPENAVVQEIQGSKVRALGMTVVLGALATIGAVMLLELKASGRRSRRFHRRPTAIGVVAETPSTR